METFRQPYEMESHECVPLCLRLHRRQLSTFVHVTEEIRKSFCSWPQSTVPSEVLHISLWKITFFYSAEQTWPPLSVCCPDSCPVPSPLCPVGSVSVCVCACVCVTHVCPPLDRELLDDEALPHRLTITPPGRGETESTSGVTEQTTEGEFRAERG